MAEPRFEDTAFADHLPLPPTDVESHPDCDCGLDPKLDPARCPLCGVFVGSPSHGHDDPERGAGR